MSMLTPPGMGGKYRITGNRYPRMRRPRHRRRFALLAIGAVAALTLMGWGTLQLIDVFSDGGGQARAAGGPKDSGSKSGKAGEAGKAGAGADGKRCEPGKATGASPDAKPKPSAKPPETGSLPQPPEVAVNVYNATKRAGLAKETADELKKRGFKIGRVGNAEPEYDEKVKSTGLLVGAQKISGERFQVLGTQLSGTTTKTDKRETGDIDLIIGDKFKKLATEDEAEAALNVLTGASPVPSASPSC